MANTDKLTPKREKFCQNIVSGMAQADAYRDAYPEDTSQDKTIRENACRLMRNSNVIARIEELKGEVIKDIKYEREDCFAEIDEILALAKQEKNYQLALKAIEDKGKLMQLFVEKIENHNINQTPFEVVIKK